MPQKESGGSELLEWLAAECGCGYLSDLRVPETAPALAQTVKRIPHGIWSGEAWREVARYITGESDIIPEEDVARAALSRWLQKRSPNKRRAAKQCFAARLLLGLEGEEVISRRAAAR